MNPYHLISMWSLHSSARSVTASGSLAEAPPYRARQVPVPLELLLDVLELPENKLQAESSSGLQLAELGFFLPRTG